MTEDSDLDYDIYSYRLFPWISKSHVLSYRFCQRGFWYRYLKKEDLVDTVKLSTGVNMHKIFAEFFGRIDYQKLKSIRIEYRKQLDRTRVYDLIYRTAMEKIPSESRDFKPYMFNVRNFSLLQTSHWIELNKKFGEEYSKVIKFFVPKMIEEYKEYEKTQMFGTIDVGYLWEEDEKVTIIYDYKTGRVPVEILEERGVKAGDPFSWGLPPKKNFELHFYIFLDMCSRGYELAKPLVDFCTKEENFNRDAKVPKVRSYFYDKTGAPVDFEKLYRTGIIYTGFEERPFVPKRRPTKASMRTVFSWVNRIRTVLKENGPFLKKPSFFQCRHCNDAIREKCLTEEEKNLFNIDEDKK